MGKTTVLKDLVVESKDGEWGKDESFEDSTQMGIIRGTDFDDVRGGILSNLPLRFIKKTNAIKKY